MGCRAYWRSLAEKAWQLGDVARYAPSLIESQRLGDLSITLIGMAVDICEGPTLPIVAALMIGNYLSQGLYAGRPSVIRTATCFEA